MKHIKVLIVGYGSSGKRYAKILKRDLNISNINIVTKNKRCNYKKFNQLSFVKNLNFDLVIICSETFKHYHQLNFFEKNFKNTKIIVEKPLFAENKKINIKNNKVFVGYNLRFDPMIEFVKKRLINQNIFFCNLNCFSFLPAWKKGRNYSKSYSASKLKGGGVTRDLSHEIDLAYYLANLKKILFARNTKVSNLKINSDDVAFLVGKNNRKSLISINLNFSYHKDVRQIFLSTKMESFFIDLINRNLIIKTPKKEKQFRFKKNKIESTYLALLKDVILNKKKCCNIKEGIMINSFIGKFTKI